MFWMTLRIQNQYVLKKVFVILLLILLLSNSCGMPGTVCSNTWSGDLSGGMFGNVYENTHMIQIPDGYGFEEAFLQKRHIDGTPNVYILTDQYPPIGSTGAVTIHVHVGLTGGIDPENIEYRVCIRSTIQSYR